MTSVSVIIPVYNGAGTLTRCLDSVFRSSYTDFEVIVVDDASIDSSAVTASHFPCQILRLKHRAGPAKARNLGAEVSKGGILFFIDSDVMMEPSTIERAVSVLDEHPELAGVIGSYTKMTPEQNFFSRYKNLLHHYTHQTCAGEVASFFTACGAIRKSVFDSISGYDVSITTTALEDVELGYRIFCHGHRIFLDRHLQVSHLKHYTLWSLVRSDLFGRAIPYTKIMLKHRMYPRELSTKNHNILSVALVYFFLGNLLFMMIWYGYFLGLMIGLTISVLLLILNRDFYRFLWREVGWSFTLRAILMQWGGYFYSGLGLGIGALSYLVSSTIACYRRRMSPKKGERSPYPG